MPEPKKSRAPKRTPQEIAVEAVEVEGRRQARLSEQVLRLRTEYAEAEEERAASERKLTWLLSHPDLPEGYEYRRPASEGGAESEGKP